MTAAAAPLEQDASSARETVHERIYRELRTAIITGRYVPGRPLTLRGVAAEFGVSPMPVREAIRQLVAERALVMFDNRRVAVPSMSSARFAELCLARMLLEPQLATLALPHIGKADLDAMTAIDARIAHALARRDIAGYLHQNHAFHFQLYRSAGSTVLLPMVESLWLQAGPFLRLMLDRPGSGEVQVHHQAAIRAIRTRDGTALREAIRHSVLDGQEIIGRDILMQPKRSRGWLRKV